MITRVVLTQIYFLLLWQWCIGDQLCSVYSAIISKLWTHNIQIALSVKIFLFLNLISCTATYRLPLKISSSFIIYFFSFINNQNKKISELDLYLCSWGQYLCPLRAGAAARMPRTDEVTCCRPRGPNCRNFVTRGTGFPASRHVTYDTRHVTRDVYYWTPELEFEGSTGEGGGAEGVADE